MLVAIVHVHKTNMCNGFLMCSTITVIYIPCTVIRIVLIDTLNEPRNFNNICLVRNLWIRLIKCKTRFDVTWHRKQSILCEAEKFCFSFEKRRFLFLWKERGECLHLRMDVNIFCPTISWHQNDSGVVIFRITGTHSIKSNLTCKTELMWLTGSS